MLRTVLLLFDYPFHILYIKKIVPRVLKLDFQLNRLSILNILVRVLIRFYLNHPLLKA